MMSYAQKKSTYFIYPFLVSYQVIEPSGVNQTEKKTVDMKMTPLTENNSTKEEKLNDVETPASNTPNKETKKETVNLNAIDGQTQIDMYYIAYLIKTQLFNTRYQREVEDAYDMTTINQLAAQYSDKELRTMSKGKSKKVGQYRL